jgi:ribosomal protein S11
MPRGGPRTGAGRKPGAVTKKTREIAEKAIEQGITPLDVMLGTMRELWSKAEKGESGLSGDKIITPLDYRLQAADVAQKAAPFVHPKLSNVEAKVTADVTQQTVTQADLAEAVKNADQIRDEY